MVRLPAPEAKRIVIVDWSMIGDLIMLSPAVRAIRAHYPEAHLAILGQPSSIASYKHHPAVSELIPYDRSGGDWDFSTFMAAVRLLRAQHFDVAFIFHNSIGSALMCWLARIPQRIGYRHEMRDLLLTRRLRQADKRQHLIETKLDLLRMCSIPISDLHEEVYIDSEKAAAWIREKLGPNLGRRRPIVGISLGATREYKRWTAAGLNQLLNMFPVNSADFVFLGAPADRELFSDVYSYNNTVVDLVGHTTIEELSWALDKVDLYIGPDSGPLHLAVGRQTPVVALFGPTDPARCGPYEYPRGAVIRAERICPRCDALYGKHIRQCLHTIDPSEVYFACVGLLAQHCRRWSIELA